MPRKNPITSSYSGPGKQPVEAEAPPPKYDKFNDVVAANAEPLKADALDAQRKAEAPGASYLDKIKAAAYTAVDKTVDSSVEKKAAHDAEVIRKKGPQPYAVNDQLLGTATEHLHDSKVRAHDVGAAALSQIPTFNDFAAAAQSRETPQTAGPNFESSKVAIGQRGDAIEAAGGSMASGAGALNNVGQGSEAALGRLAAYQEKVMRGEAGASVAESQLQGGRDRAIQNAFAVANSTPGGRYNPAAMAGAARAASTAQTDFERDQAGLRASEQAKAAELAGGFRASQGGLGIERAAGYAALAGLGNDQARIALTGEELAMRRALDAEAAAAANADRILKGRAINDDASATGWGAADAAFGRGLEGVGIGADLSKNLLGNTLGAEALKQKSWHDADALRVALMTDHAPAEPLIDPGLTNLISTGAALTATAFAGPAGGAVAGPTTKVALDAANDAGTKKK